MGDYRYTPSVRVQIVSGAAGNGPTDVPGIIEAQSALTLAAAVGQAQLVIADADSHWFDALRPNDIVTLTYSSRQYPDPATAPRPSWTGLVDTVTRTRDPQSPDGLATRVTASSFWKLLTITAVPLFRFQTGQYPGPSIGIQNMLDTALGDVFTNTGIRVATEYDSAAINAMTPPLQFPNDFTNPQNQSWASFLLSQVIVAGIEVFFDETGTLVVRAPQYATSPTNDIPDEEIWSIDAAVSDAGLVTNTVVGYGVVPLSSTGVEAPANGAENRNFGDLPAALKDSSGQPLARLGQRFLSLTVPWLQTQADAGRYAATVRQLGLATADQADVTAILRGDIPIGTTVTLSGQGKRYYVVTCEPLFRFGEQQQTRLTLRYGLGIGETWNVASLSNYGNLSLPGYQNNTTLDGTTQPASLPALALDPSILLTDPTLTKDDLYRIMTMPPGCAFANQATYIWQEAQQYGIDPSFALAVWMIETRLGTDGSTGSQQFNPGNLGPFIPFTSWQAGIDAWFIFIKKLVGQGKTTIQTVASTYIPDSPANPHQMEDWIRNVSGQMESYRGQHRVAAIPNALPAAGAGGGPTTPGDGTQPHGYPFIGKTLYPVTQPFANQYSGEPAATYNGVAYAHFHRGIDFGCPSGTFIKATMNGTITLGSDPQGYGTYVLLTNNPWQVMYGHTEGLAAGITDGQQVKAGDTVALSDNTGNSTGPHLHFELRRNGVFTDPVPYLG